MNLEAVKRRDPLDRGVERSFVALRDDAKIDGVRIVRTELRERLRGDVAGKLCDERLDIQEPSRQCHVRIEMELVRDWACARQRLEHVAAR
ncbi:MAG TPA: hypothetical protein VF403_17610 [Kofleriaceae bacterium]